MVCKTILLSLFAVSLPCGEMLYAQELAEPLAAKDDANFSDDPLLERTAPLDPKHNRTEAEEDKLAASSWFLRGRLAFQREDNVEALRCYQRAWRYDPSAVSILREIVPLAFELKQNAVAARYAVIMAEKAPRDAVLLRRLAQHLMDERDYTRALKLYEKSMELRDEADRNDAREVLSQMEIARLYFLEEQYEQAAAAFDVVRDALDHPEKYELSDKIHTTLLGNPRVTYTLIGESFLKAGRLEEASEMFERAMPDKASAPLLAFHLARIEMENGRPRSALDQLNKYLVAKQTSAGNSPYHLLERVYDELHEDDEAATRLRKRLEESYHDDPANSAVAYFLADKYRAWDDLDEAASLLETTLRTEPTVAGYAALIDIYHQQNKADKLLDALGKAIEQTGSFRPLSDEIEALADDEKLVSKLWEVIKERQKEAGGEPNVHQALAMGLLAIEAGMFDAADEQMNIAAAADEQREAAVLESWGLQMFIAGESARAAKIFQRAIDDKVAERFNGDFYYYLAAALEFDAQTDAALEAAKRAAEEKPESPRYDARQAWVLYHAQRYEEAEREYKKLLEKYDDNHSDEDYREVVREARMILSNIAIHLDRTSEAVERLEQVLDEYPEDIGSFNDLGYLWSDQGQHLQRSLRMIQTAVEAEPDNAAYRDSLGWAHFRLGNYDDAIAELEKAAEMLKDEPDGVILDHLGDAYNAADRQQDAVKVWGRAVELFRKDEDQQKADATQKKIEMAKDQ